MKHTPGPWRVEFPDIVSIADKDGDWPVICRFPREERTIVPIEETMGNAHLIALATEMLEVLEALLMKAAKGYYDFHMYEEKINEVLRKARGD